MLSSESGGALVLWWCDSCSPLLGFAAALFLIARAELNWTAVYVWYVWWDVVIRPSAE